MKKTIILLAALAFLCAGSASAQGVLGKLKDKATQAVENKVESAVGKAIFGDEKALSSDSKTSTTSNKKSGDTYESAPDDYYVTCLIDDGISEWKPSFEVEKEEGKEYEPSVSYKTYGEALAAMPELPTAKQMITDEGREAYAKQIRDYDLAVQIMQTEYVMAVANYTNSIGSVMNQAGEALSALDTPEVAAAMEVAEEWQKLPEAEAKKIEAMSEKDEEAALAYIKANHPTLYKKINNMQTTSLANGKTEPEIKSAIDEDKAERYNAVGEKLSDIQEKKTQEMTTYMTEMAKTAAKAAITGKDIAIGTNKAETELMTLRKEIIKAWAGSEEAAEVLKMEAELNAKTNRWMKDNNKNWNNELPAFWKEGRQAQNEVIDKWNMKQAVKWRKLIQQLIDEQMVDAKQIIALDDELEAIRGGAEGDAIYWSNKMYSGMLNSTVINALLLHRMALDAPLVKHVLEYNIQ